MAAPMTRMIAGRLGGRRTRFSLLQCGRWKACSRPSAGILLSLHHIERLVPGRAPLVSHALILADLGRTPRGSGSVNSLGGSPGDSEPVAGG